MEVTHDGDLDVVAMQCRDHVDDLWRAKAALAAAFAPGRYGPSFVGTRYLLTSDDAPVSD